MNCWRNFSNFLHTKTKTFTASRQKKNGRTLLEALRSAASNWPGALLLSPIFCIPIHLLLCPSLFCSCSHSLNLVVLLLCSSEVCWGTCIRVCGHAAFVLNHAGWSWLCCTATCLRSRASVSGSARCMHLTVLLASTYTTHFNFLDPFFKFTFCTLSRI